MVEALRLAAELDQYLYSVPAHPLCTDAAAELRRLYDANEAFGKRQQWWNERMFTLEQQRDALLEFAKYVEAIDPNNQAPLFEKARTVIKAVEGEKP